MKHSNRSKVDPFIVMDVMEEARTLEAEGRRIIHMEVGQPSTPAPKRARVALGQAMEQDALGYTVALGLPALRQRIATLYNEWYGIELDPGRVVVTAGSSAAFLLAFTALFDAGDRVGIGAPGYPSYRQILKALSLVPLDVETQSANKFQPTVAELDAVNLAGFLVASPANPTGAILSVEELKALADWAKGTGKAFISDEIYHGIAYDAPAATALSVTDHVYVINSFSKYFSMTGWRIGWMIVPPDHVRMIERLAQNMFICPPHASQVAALAALDASDELEHNVAVYRANRSLVVEGLRDMGITDFVAPDGAFYVYADVAHLTDDSRAFASQVLNTAGVALTPGLDFDQRRGHRMIRLSYARSTEDIREGLARLKDYVGQLT